MGPSLLAHAYVFMTFWDHSFTMETYIINRLLIIGLLEFISPYFVLHKKLPSYQSLKNFGCLCFPSLKTYNQHKVQFQSEECVFLGVSLLNTRGTSSITKLELFISKNVSFIEYKLPYLSIFPNATCSVYHKASS